MRMFANCFSSSAPWRMYSSTGTIILYVKVVHHQLAKDRINHHRSWHVLVAIMGPLHFLVGFFENTACVKLKNWWWVTKSFQEGLVATFLIRLFTSYCSAMYSNQSQILPDRMSCTFDWTYFLADHKMKIMHSEFISLHLFIPWPSLHMITQVGSVRTRLLQSTLWRQKGNSNLFEQLLRPSQSEPGCSHLELKSAIIFFSQQKSVALEWRGRSALSKNAADVVGFLITTKHWTFLIFLDRVR